MASEPVPHGTEPEKAAPTVFKPHPKQWQMMQCPCHEILYGGGAGGGKTKALGFDWTAHHAIHKGAAKGLLVRRTNSELEDMIRDLQNMFSTLPNPPRWMEQKRIFLYPDGAVLEMGYLESWEDVYRYQGREFNWMGWDELTQWPTEDQYEYLLTRMRSSKGVKVRVISTTNPGGPGHAWVLARFKIDENPKGNKVYKKVTRLQDGSEKVWTYVFIPALLADNPSLDADGEYRANLMNRGKVMRSMLLDGRWDVLEGAFFPEWNPDVHIVPDSIPPPHAKKWMAGDWGTTKPYCFLWAYEASNGDVIIYDELYGGVEGKNVGLRHNASYVAQLIREKERNWGHYITERYLDIECFSMDGHEITVAGLFAKEGVHFQKAIKKNKAGGIENLREYLKVVNGVSRLKVMHKCRNLIRTLPRLQTDKTRPDQYDSDGEDHCLAGSTRILTNDGWQSIGDLANMGSHARTVDAMTPLGPYPAYNFRKTGTKQTFRMSLSNGKWVDATANHKFLVAGKGFVRLDGISVGDTLLYGGGHGASDNLGDDPGVRWGTVLPVRALFPAPWLTIAPEGVDVCEWPYPEGAPCPSCGRESCSQCTLESRIEGGARALSSTYDDAGTARAVQGARQEGNCGGTSMAQVGGREAVALRTREGVGGGHQEEVDGRAGYPAPVLLVPERVPSEGGFVLLQSGLPNTGAQARYYGVRVEEIRAKAVEDVYDCTVDEAHCFLTEAGVFAHNCADCALYLVRRNTPTEEEIKKKARSGKAREYLERQNGPYGIY